MNIKSILTPERTHCGISAGSKKRVLEEIAYRLSETLEDLSTEDIFTHLINREKMGSTAIGHGIAIPHCRLDGCDEVIGALFTVQKAIDFHAIDETMVEVLFVLLVPTEEVDEHLQVLAMLANKFESAPYRESLKQAKLDMVLYQAAIEETVGNVAQI